MNDNYTGHWLTSLYMLFDKLRMISIMLLKDRELNTLKYDD
jgi:hypothetical protein